MDVPIAVGSDLRDRVRLHVVSPCNFHEFYSKTPTDNVAICICMLKGSKRLEGGLLKRSSDCYESVT
jgi:hypothetical protein